MHMCVRTHMCVSVCVHEMNVGCVHLCEGVHLYVCMGVCMPMCKVRHFPQSLPTLFFQIRSLIEPELDTQLLHGFWTLVLTRDKHFYFLGHLSSAGSSELMTRACKPSPREAEARGLL